MTSNDDRREAKMGSRGEVPCLGLGDEIPIVPMREAPITRIREKPKAPILILIHSDRIFACIPTGCALRCALGE